MLTSFAGRSRASDKSELSGEADCAENGSGLEVGSESAIGSDDNSDDRSTLPRRGSNKYTNE